MPENSGEDEGQLTQSARFPSTARTERADKINPAIMLYGRRFYKDQTPVEYLAEFLLVFASEKGEERAGSDFSLMLDSTRGQPCYWPADRVALKLFAFFPSSKLETRHPVHQSAYLLALDDIKARIAGSDEEKDETVRLFQSLFSGFVGVARNRTWVTHSFLPASPGLLAREIGWKHAQAMKDDSLENWHDAEKYFATDQHNFMARGGELLFLQLANLFSNTQHESANILQETSGYSHLNNIDLTQLRISIEGGLKSILEDAVGPINDIAQFIESALDSYQLRQTGDQATLGWVPSASVPEALLFATELKNICNSTLGALEKIELLQILCSMQVLRSHCFQASRVDTPEQKVDGFFGGYAWIVADSAAQSGSAIRRLAQSCFSNVEEMLYRALREVGKGSGSGALDFKQADKHGFQIFRKISKELGLVVPRTGSGQRFVLPPTLLRFLVSALLAPGERVRLTVFYARVFAHYGIALGDQQLLQAMNWISTGKKRRDYSVAADTVWIEEALQQGGFLVELSDAVSIVHNQGGVGQQT